jgi:hypothetical protein
MCCRSDSDYYGVSLYVWTYWSRLLWCLMVCVAVLIQIIMVSHGMCGHTDPDYYGVSWYVWPYWSFLDSSLNKNAWQTALLPPPWKKSCYGRLLKILGPMASMITTRPLRMTNFTSLSRASSTVKCRGLAKSMPHLTVLCLWSGQSPVHSLLELSYILCSLVVV